MGLSRLNNFLKSVRGEIIYVDPNSLDATDSIENTGNSLTRPFKTIQRALIEASRFSYQRGLNNDRFGRTTILLYPGEHIVDNRPGWIGIGPNNFLLRDGRTSNNLPAWDLTTNFDLISDENALYKMNSVYGGVIVPRGTSIVGLDLRKTRIRPKYVPNPENINIERSSLFRVTGACYFWQFTVLDADPNSVCYKDYTNNIFVPNFSHHKLTCFEYADGVNSVNIDDDFVTYSTDRTDLDIYYEKVGRVYGTASGREVYPDFATATLDLEPKIDEFRIVGSRGAEVGISSIRSGDGSIGSKVITVTLSEPFLGLAVDTPIRIEGVGVPGYDGQYVVSEVLSPTQIQYQVQNTPINIAPSAFDVLSATLNISVDTVTSASPYIFNCSLRSVYGMCGLHADGSKADGFKSMVVAQFTGIGLQKDNNAFVKFNPSTGLYQDNTAFGNENIHTDSRAIYKPAYENFHIKASNDAYIQVVSVFAIGYANHFLVESGGDHSINNSNSNFGSKSLVAKGFKNDSFARDDVGYITHIIPPKEFESEEISVNYLPIDVPSTISVANTSRLYLYEENNQSIPPDHVINGYRIGSNRDDTLYVVLDSTEYSSPICFANSENASGIKINPVERIGNLNNINPSTNIITFTDQHFFLNGESVRVISDNGDMPIGLENNKIYFAITQSISPNPVLANNEIKLAKTLDDALNDISIQLNDEGGKLIIESRVSDKKSGDIGHPIQWDESQNQWYITSSDFNPIYNQIVSLGSAILGQSTPRTYFKRANSSRTLNDSIYRSRYVIPKDSPVAARPPIEGYVLQDTTVPISNDVSYLFSLTNSTLLNPTELRVSNLIATASWSSSTLKATINSELPHNLSVGSVVEISNVSSTNNLNAEDDLGYNGSFEVAEIINRKQFTINLSTDPGIFQNNTSVRNSSLPYFRRKRYNSTYIVYRSEEIQEYIPGIQDGIYHLLLVNASNSPKVQPFQNQNFLQPIQNLYPQLDRDNPIADPDSSSTFALPSPIGQVAINDVQRSITKETLEKTLLDNGSATKISQINTDPVGLAHTIVTEIEHGLNPVTRVTIITGGSGYGVGSASTQTFYNATLLTSSGSGANATARVTVNSLGSIIDVRIIDGGSAYQIGDLLTVSGIPTQPGFAAATLTVASIYNNVGDSLRVMGVGGFIESEYNNLYRITSIPSPTIVQTLSSVFISGTLGGISSPTTENAFLKLTGKAILANSFSYDNLTGTATILTNESHNFNTNDKVRLTGSDSVFYRGDFIVRKIISPNAFTVFIGTSDTTPPTSGTIYIYPTGYTSNNGTLTKTDESLSSRLLPDYSGIRTTLTGAINASSSTIAVPDALNLGLKIGDYLLINNEILRIRSTITTNTITVYRGLLGTKASSHSTSSVVAKINPRPVEFRRNSIIRASAHTFEYLGFGPGNYSTAFPERQDRAISEQEELLAQSTKYDGGVVVYTGMNADGDFYIGNKKINSTTGQEKVYDTPIPTVTGEDPESVTDFNLINSSEVSVTRSIRVEGGSDGNLISEFDGPVIFNNKIVSNSSKGIQANSVFLQGNAETAREYTVGISTPALSANPGDVKFKSNPNSGGNLGWVYTTNNRWEQFSPVQTNGVYVGIWSGTFVGDGSGLQNVDSVWTVTSAGIHTTRNVGIGTTTANVNLGLDVYGRTKITPETSSGFALDVGGNTRITGTLNVFEVIEKATISSGILTATSVTNINLADNNVYYFTNQARDNWTFNFRGDATTPLNNFLEVGDSITVAILTEQGNPAYYNSAITIDGNPVTPRYYGGVQYQFGNINSIDTYTFVIIKTANNTYTVLASQSQYK